MNLCKLLKNVGIASNFENVEVFNVTENIDNVKKGSLFVAVKGKSYDGNNFINEAFSRGAVACVSDCNIDRENIIKVSNSRKMLSFLSSEFFSNPQDKMKVIGITGTNGKTTTAEYIKHILSFNGKKCGVIGTLGSTFDDYNCATGYTTPSAEVLFQELKKHAQAGNEYCIMEVSSQALDQHRVDPIEFEIGLFTNIDRDHLDYHGTIENYRNAKTKLINISKQTILNADDFYLKKLYTASPEKKLTYSIYDNYADFMAKNIRYNGNVISYIVFSSGNLARVKYTGLGEMSVYNTLSAISCSNVLGIDFDACVKAIENLPEISGRAEIKDYNGIKVCIDFAHTPVALEKCLKALKLLKPKKIICVFGCGGNRDSGKRSEMGMVASHEADIVIITSDNPRNEDPENIYNDIIININNKKNIFKELDRKKAIEQALAKADKDDVVLIAGKGHEEYQIFNDKKIYFSDKSIVEDFFR